MPFSRLIAGTIDRNINITIFVHVLAQRFKRMIFHLKLPEGWIFSKVKTSDIVNGSLNLAETSFTNKASRCHVCCEVCKLKSRALSHKPSSDCVIARTKGPVRAQASYGNITVLSLLKRQTPKVNIYLLHIKTFLQLTVCK